MNKREAINKRDEIINGFSKLRSYYADALFSDQDDDPESKYFYVSRFEDVYKEIVNKINEFTESVSNAFIIINNERIEWIRTDETLPKDGEKVLFTTRIDSVGENKYIYDVHSGIFNADYKTFEMELQDLDHGQFYHDVYPLSNVIAWIPRPKPYISKE